MTEPNQTKPQGEPADISEEKDQARQRALQERGSRQPVTLVDADTLNATGQPEAEPDPLDSALKDAAENRDRWMRAVAELENYKKRALQERSKLLKYRNEDLLRELLPVVDNMDRALSHCPADGPCDPLTEGVRMISDIFHAILERFGVTAINAQGQPFDPHVHEALARIPDPKAQPNMVVEVLEKGYMYQDRLLRPAKVAVSMPPVEGGTEDVSH